MDQIAPKTATITRAAQYLRMSTEDQIYSIGNQAAAIADYAAQHDLEVVRTYADEGQSGLHLERREGLQQLLRDVLLDHPGFSLVLIYDVSRWGRFQDPDEGAHYEFICRQAGVRVEYCAEAFVNDASLASTLMKSVKRAMAADFSRAIGRKMGLGRRRAAQAGFWVGGGPPGYGLRRRIVRSDGSPGVMLGPGERKALQSDRVTLVPGPPQEVANVLRIYRLFVVSGLTWTAIAKLLNAEGLPAEGGGPWTMNRVRRVITSEKYVGANVFGKTAHPLGECARRLPRNEWTRVPGAFEGIVPLELFKVANANVRTHRRSPSDDRLIDDLRGLAASGTAPSSKTIRDAPNLYCPAVYQRRFGSLSRAYELAGYEMTRKQRLAAHRASGGTAGISRYRRPDISEPEMLGLLGQSPGDAGPRLNVRIINEAPGLPSAHAYRERFGGMRRAYALVGYEPGGQQASALKRSRGQSITVEAAAALAKTAASKSFGVPGPWSLD